MAKLVDLLAKYLVEWPVDKKYPLEQDAHGAIYVSSSVHKSGEKFYKNITINLAEDFVDAVVYYADWLAARDRLHEETLKEMIQVGGVLEAQEFDADQALWDNVALQTHEALFRTQDGKAMGFDERAEFSFNEADAFMAERAKRLKGGV